MKKIYIYPKKLHLFNIALAKLKRSWKIIFLCLLTSVLCPPSSFSQTAPVIEWQKCLGGSLSDAGSSVQQTNDGGFIVGGATRSNNGNVSGNHGDYDYWAAKLDPAGNVEWQKCFGGSDWDAGGLIRQKTNGGYIFSGYTQSNNGDVSGNHGFTDTWIVNLDSVGNIVWQKCLGGTAGENNFRIKQTTDGGFASVSWSKSNDGNVTSNYGSDDFWLVKQDSSGNIEWEKSYGGTWQDMGNDICQTSDGGFLLGGSTSSVDSNVTGNHGGIDCWIVKLDSVGNLQWQKCLGGALQDESLSAMQTSDGGYIVTSRAYSNDGDISSNHGSADGWVVKLDPSGNIIWQKCFGGSNHDGFFHADEAPDGNIVLLGYTYSNDGDVSGNHDTTAAFCDVWVVKIDSLGTILWQKCLGGSNSEASYTIEVTSDGGNIISGFTSSNNGDVSGNHGQEDFWIIKLAPDTITGISQLPQLSNYPITISPNPLTTQSKLTFKNPNKEKFLFTLYDITGRITESVSSINNEIILTKGSKQAGVYLFNLMNEKTGERMNGKIVISD